ncbi:MAG: hypothetical protein WAK16_05970 [Candidatus Cybelea sp.]
MRRVFIRSIVAALLLCVAFSFGQYMIAPGGQYTFYSLEAQSFDPATYRWFFQDLNLVVQMVPFNALFLAPVPVLIAIVIASLLTLVKPLASTARAWIQLKWSWLVAGLVVSYIAGFLHTIHAGVNPGICC